MSTTLGVVGVLGLCWVELVVATHCKCAFCAGLRCADWGVLGFASRTRMRVVFRQGNKEKNIPHANPQKLNKPNTLNTEPLNLLKSLVFGCVGFVSGSAVLCRVQVFWGIQG